MQFGDDLAGGEIGRQKTHIVGGLGQHASETGKEHGAPILVIAGAQDEFNSRGLHAFDQDAVEDETGPIDFHRSMQIGPGLGQGGLGGDSEENATGVALVGQVLGLRFQDHRESDLACDVHSVIEIAREAAHRGRDSKLLQELLGPVFGEDSGRDAAIAGTRVERGSAHGSALQAASRDASEGAKGTLGRRKAGNSEIAQFCNRAGIEGRSFIEGREDDRLFRLQGSDGAKNRRKLEGGSGGVGEDDG